MPIATSTKTNTHGIANVAIGKVVSDGGTPVDTDVIIGFTPRYFRWFDATPGAISFEVFEGMAAASCYRTVLAGDRTLDAAAGPVIGKGVVTIKAADIPASKTFMWMAIG